MPGIKPLRLGLVGCNSSLQYVYGPHSFHALTGGELVAVMDIDESRAREGCDKLGAKRWYTDYDALLRDDEVEAVVLVSPGWCHEEQTVTAAAAGKHVLCEKPMACLVEECDRMIRACEEASVTLMVAHMKRFNLSFRRVHQMIRGGELGRVFAIRGQWDEPARDLGGGDTFRSDPRSVGGHWHDHGAHMSDLACWWTGRPVVRVQGILRSLGQNMTAAEDFSIATLEHEDGALSTHQTTVYTYRPWYETYEVIAEKGTLVINSPRHSSLTFEPPTIHLYDHTEGHFNYRRVDVTPYLQWDVDQQTRAANQYLQELEHFCRCVRTGKEPLVTGQDGRHAVEIINATYLSHFRNKWVQLPLHDTGELPGLFAQYRRDRIDERQARGGRTQ